MPLRIILDTNIFRGDIFRQSQGFKTLSHLCKVGQIELVLPDIVRREFETQLGADDADAVAKFKKAAGELLERAMPVDIKNAIDELLKELEAKKAEVVQASAVSFVAWTKEHAVKDLPLSGDQALAAMDAYFNAGKPFKAAKERKDLPDAMIYQSLLQLATEGPLGLVCSDGKLSEACSSIDGVTVYQNLKELIASETVQTLIVQGEAPKKAVQEAEAQPTATADSWMEADVIPSLTQDAQLLQVGQNIKAIIEGLRQLSLKDQNALTSYVSSHGGESLASTTFHSPSIPGDDREAYIAMFGELNDVQFEWEQAAYHGNSIYIVPFQAAGYFNISYYVPKWDVEEIESRGATYSEHNDYVVEAEEEAELSISGALRVVVAVDYQSGDEIENAIEDLEIDSVDSPMLTEDVGTT
jgi:hypothetical protein